MALETEDGKTRFVHPIPNIGKRFVEVMKPTNIYPSISMNLIQHKKWIINYLVSYQKKKKIIQLTGVKVLCVCEYIYRKQAYTSNQRNTC